MTVAAWLEDWITKSLAASDRKQATKDLYATLTAEQKTLADQRLGGRRGFAMGHGDHHR